MTLARALGGVAALLTVSGITKRLNAPRRPTRGRVKATTAANLGVPRGRDGFTW